MMPNTVNLINAKVRKRIGALLSITFGALSLLLLTPSASAEHYYLTPGKSRDITAPAGLDTVFVSNPSVADYKIVNNNKIVIYGRQTGYSDITLYDKKANVLNKISVEVDPLLADVLTRIKTLFPQSKVRVSKVNGTEQGKAIYILSGTVPTEEARDVIYNLVGQAAGGQSKDRTVQASGDSESGISGSGDINFMTYKSYDNVINRLILPQTNQVNVRLTVVEVNKEFKDNIGIEWSNGGSSGTFSLLGFKGFNRFDIHNMINALQNDTVARILAQPNLTVLSGETASFLVGGEVPITVRDSVNNTSNIEYKEYGVKLSIAAKVEDSNKIRLFISNELSSVDTSYAMDDLSVPKFKTRKTSSTIELADGNSFAIAGLLNEQDLESLSKIPFFGDIPILGALARNVSTTRSKTELMVFATVNLVKPTTSSANIELPVFNKTTTSQLFWNVGVDKQTRSNRLKDNIPFDHDVKLFLERSGFSK